MLFRSTQIAVMHLAAIVGAVPGQRSSRHSGAELLRFDASDARLGKTPGDHHEDRSDSAAHIERTGRCFTKRADGDEGGDEIVERPPVTALLLKDAPVSGEAAQIFVRARREVETRSGAARSGPRRYPALRPARRSNDAFCHAADSDTGRAISNSWSETPEWRAEIHGHTSGFRVLRLANQGCLT